MEKIYTSTRNKALARTPKEAVVKGIAAVSYTHLDPVYDRCNYLVSGCKRTFSGGVRLSKAKGHYAAS